MGSQQKTSTKLPRRIRMVKDTEPMGSLSNMWRESQERRLAPGW